MNFAVEDLSFLVHGARLVELASVHHNNSARYFYLVAFHCLGWPMGSRYGLLLASGARRYCCGVYASLSFSFLRCYCLSLILFLGGVQPRRRPRWRGIGQMGTHVHQRRHTEVLVQSGQKLLLSRMSRFKINKN